MSFYLKLIGHYLLDIGSKLYKYYVTKNDYQIYRHFVQTIPLSVYLPSDNK